MDLLVEIRADIEDHFLLKMVIEDDAGAIEAVLGKKTAQGDKNPEEELFMPIGVGNNLIDDVSGDPREDDDREGHYRGTKQLGRSQLGISAEIGKNPKDALHGSNLPAV